jgi:hypothetical protein
LGLIWLKDIFNKYIKDCTKGVYRLLILDGYRSYSTPAFDLFCKEYNIITLCIPLHSLHLLQPLDISCFAVLKRTYGKQIEQYIRVGVSYIDKPDFLTALLAARNISIASDIIRNGFRATGLYPYDPDQVLSKLYT